MVSRQNPASCKWSRSWGVRFVQMESQANNGILCRMIICHAWALILSQLPTQLGSVPQKNYCPSCFSFVNIWMQEINGMKTTCMRRPWPSEVSAGSNNVTSQFGLLYFRCVNCARWYLRVYDNVWPWWLCLSGVSPHKVLVYAPVLFETVLNRSSYLVCSPTSVSSHNIHTTSFMLLLWLSWNHNPIHLSDESRTCG